MGLAFVAVAFFSEPASAASFDGASLTLVWVLPFAGMLASIAIFPLVAPQVWHHHFGKIAFGWAAAFVVPFAVVFGPATAVEQLAHAALVEYLPFVILLFALYTVSGGIGVFGNLHGSPGTNVALLATGAVLANLMGTTGAAMVLVRPLIRANDNRRHNAHVLVFFIFIVANAGGSLTPLGDPPLFLGFLNGVSFFWTTHAMLGPTLTLCGALLAVFYLLDRHLYAKAGEERPAYEDLTPDSRLRIAGRGNVLLLGAVIGAVLISGLWRPGVLVEVFGTPLEGQGPGARRAPRRHRARVVANHAAVDPRSERLRLGSDAGGREALRGHLRDDRAGHRDPARR